MQLYQIAILQTDEKGNYVQVLTEPYWKLAKSEQQARDMALIEYHDRGQKIDLERLAIIVRPFV